MLDSRGAVYVSTAITCLSLTLLLLRCLVRFVLLKQAGIDDFLAIGAFVCAAGVLAVLWVQCSAGLGQDVSNARDSELLFKTLWVGVLAYQLGITLTKLSALFQYLRFITHGRLRIFCLVMITFLSLSGAAVILTNVFACKPVSYFWDKQSPGTCLKLDTWWRATAIYVAATDVIVVVIPIIALKYLKQLNPLKIWLTVVFGLGTLGCAASIVRIVYLFNLTSAQGETITAEAGMYSILELNIGLICICAPILKRVCEAVSLFFKREKPTVCRVGSADYLKDDNADARCSAGKTSLSTV